ncbi:uncharacterized protein METZ01_LOCUS68655 [marine metagenome]|uniref:Uncharacterized protein n=1 Tax=marine metagenome TaxID=408172 RepID=A0A381TJW1_9ZZZZ
MSQIMDCKVWQSGATLTCGRFLGMACRWASDISDEGRPFFA